MALYRPIQAHTTRKREFFLSKTSAPIQVNVSDTLAINFSPESSINLITSSRVETTDLQFVESSINLGTLLITDTDSIQFIEVSVLLNALSRADTVAINFSTEGGTITPGAPETILIVVFDQADLLIADILVIPSLLVRTDTLSLSLTETSAAPVSKVGSDLFQITISENVTLIKTGVNLDDYYRRYLNDRILVG